MKKSCFAVLFFMFFGNVSCQFVNSVNLNAGLIMPTTGQTGTLIGLEVTHKINNTWSLYLSSGILNWNRNKVLLSWDYSDLSSYNEDNHQMYPIYIGTRMVISNIKTFQIYANLELGYNYLKYNSYQNFIITDESTKKILAFYVNQASRRETSENLIGVGFGLGFVQNISNSFSFLVEYKRNTIGNNLDNLRNHFILKSGLIFNM